MTRFWHPVANMHAVEQNGELILDRADGVYVWDEDGRRYIDATASLWYCNVGYGRNEIVDAAAAQMRKLPAYSAYDDLSSRAATELAERIAGIAPMADARVFFTSGGAESIETAAKLARRYWSHVGQPERKVVISRERAYHGMAAYGTSLAGADIVQGRAWVSWFTTQRRSRGTRRTPFGRRSTGSGPSALPPSSASR